MIKEGSGEHNRSKRPQNCMVNIKYTSLLMVKCPSNVAVNKIYFINVLESMKFSILKML